MKCPKCGGEIKWWSGELFHPGSARDCVVCGETLELTNLLVCTLINSAVFSLITLGMFFVGEYIRFVIAFLLCWLLNPFIISIFGRWKSSRYSKIQSYSIRKWSIISMAGGWVFGVAAAFTIISFALLYRDLITNIDSIFAGSNKNVMEEFVSRVRFIMPRGLAVAFVAFAICIIARIKRLRLIKKYADSELEKHNATKAGQTDIRNNNTNNKQIT